MNKDFKELSINEMNETCGGMTIGKVPNPLDRYICDINPEISRRRQHPELYPKTKY